MPEVKFMGSKRPEKNGEQSSNITVFHIRNGKRMGNIFKTKDYKKRATYDFIDYHTYYLFKLDKAKKG